jgi:hypothetical protein
MTGALTLTRSPVSTEQPAADFLIEAFGCTFDWEVKREPTPPAGERFIKHKLGGERSWADLFAVHHDAYMSHVIMLKAGDHHLAQYIELFEWRSPGQNTQWPRFSDVGHAYISFTVKDVVAVIAHLESLNVAGVRVIQDPPMQFAMRDEICSSTFVTTPFGFWIELSEWSKSKHAGKVISCTPSQVASSFTASATGANDNHAGSEAVRHPAVGKLIYECDTPAFCVDLDAVDANAALMSSRMRENGVFWRPPVKAHKCPQLARHLIESGGADGILCLKLSEAEAFAKWGFDDILIANEVVGAAKVARLVQLASTVAKLRVLVDDAENAAEIHAAVAAAGARVEGRKCGCFCDVSFVYLCNLRTQLSRSMCNVNTLYSASRN